MAKKLFELFPESRDKAKDDELFNCSQEHEITYVSQRYGANEAKVKAFLDEKCTSGAINNFTHDQLYDLIKKEMGFARKSGSDSN